MSPKNMLKLWRDKHNAWHRVYNNLTIDEVILCIHNIKPTDDWFVIWKFKSNAEIIAILQRVMRIKRQLKRKHP
jgi:hypothetical protein